MQHWEKGQLPNAVNLLTIHERLGFSFALLVIGEGEPFEVGSDNDEAVKLRAENEKLREELAQADRLNRQLTAWLLCDADPDVVTRKVSGQE